MNGATQIRAGVMRPEVIIPHIDSLKKRERAHGEVEAKGLETGAPIRVIRVPYFGKIGKVTALPPELKRMESETMVRVVEVEFDGGERVIVPRANVEKLELA
jgi:hypothetical protein